MKTSRLTMCLRAILLALFSTAATAQEDGSKITAEPVAGGVYLLRGVDASNIVVSVGEDGIVRVDDQVASAAHGILATLKAISNKPLRFVINTHAHEDHTGANAAFRKLAPVIAHRNVRERMMNGPDQRPPDAWPSVTFVGELNLLIPNDAKVVPGHGPVSSRADVEHGLVILKEMMAIVEAGIVAGKTLEQIDAEQPFEKWQGMLALTVPTKAYVARFYRELTAK